MKNIKLNQNGKFLPVYVITLFLYLIGLCNSQLVSPQGINRNGTKPLSADREFQLKKFDATLPEKNTDIYNCEVDLQNKIIKVKKKTGEEYYQITIPSIETLSPKLKRYDGDAFRGAKATLNGDIILCYHEMDEFYYSKLDNSFYLLPRYTKEEDIDYQFDNWKQIAEDFFLSKYHNQTTLGAGYAILDSKTKKLYKLKIPASIIFENEYIYLKIYDPSSRIVQVERCKDADSSIDIDVEVIADVGYYKIEEIVENP